MSDCVQQLNKQLATALIYCNKHVTIVTNGLQANDVSLEFNLPKIRQLDYSKSEMYVWRSAGYIRKSLFIFGLSLECH